MTYVADAPSDRTLFAGGGGLVCLTVDAQVHDVVAANGAVVDDDVPGPKRDCVPLCYCQHVHLMRHFSLHLHTFLTSNLFLPSVSPVLGPAFLTFGAASVISTSAMVFVTSDDVW